MFAVVYEREGSLIIKKDTDCRLKTSVQRIFSCFLKMVTEGDVTEDVGSVC